MQFYKTFTWFESQVYKTKYAYSSLVSISYLLQPYFFLCLIGNHLFLNFIFILLLFTLKVTYRTSLVVQWMGIHLPMQGIQVQSLVREDFTCHGSTKPVWHNYWAQLLQVLKHRSLRACVPQQERPPQWEACAPQLESGLRSLELKKACMEQRRPSAASK